MKNETFDMLRTLQSKTIPYAIAALGVILGALNVDAGIIAATATIATALNGVFGNVLESFREKYNAEKGGESK